MAAPIDEASGLSDIPERLRILQMSTIFGVGGIARHVLALGGWLATKGHEVAYAGTPGAWLDESMDREYLPLDIQQVSGDREDAKMLERLGHLAAASAKLRGWLRRRPVDLIHAHESAPALVARVGSLGLGIPIVVTYHGSDLARVRQFGGVARRCADQVISVSYRSAEDLETLGGVPRAMLKVVGLGLQPAPSVSAEKAQQLRRRLLGRDGRVLVTKIARLTDQKGVDVLVEVARRVVAKQPEVRFSVVGDGPLASAAERWIAEAGLQNHVHLIGRSEEPHLHLAAADIFLLTSRWEALPFTIAEAFQAGRPAIATDTGGVAELIDDKVGRVVPVGDVDALAAAVLELAGDAGLRETLSAAALERSREDRFKPDFNHRQIELTYRALLASRGAASRRR